MTVLNRSLSTAIAGCNACPHSEGTLDGPTIRVVVSRKIAPYESSFPRYVNRAPLLIRERIVRSPDAPNNRVLVDNSNYGLGADPLRRDKRDVFHTVVDTMGRVLPCARTQARSCKLPGSLSETLEAHERARSRQCHAPPQKRPAIYTTPSREGSLLPPLPPSWRGGRGGVRPHTVRQQAKQTPTQNHNAGWRAADALPSEIEWLRRHRKQTP